MYHCLNLYTKLYIHRSIEFITPSFLLHFQSSVWQGVTMDFLKFHPGPPCFTVICLAGGLPGVGLPAGWVACGCLLPFWTPHAVRLCISLQRSLTEFAILHLSLQICQSANNRKNSFHMDCTMSMVCGVEIFQKKINYSVET
jgi:hypothetical protein